MKVLGSVPKSDIDKALSELRRDKNFKAIEANFLGLALILAIAIALFLYVFNSRRLEEFKKGIEDLDKD